MAEDDRTRPLDALQCFFVETEAKVVRVFLVFLSIAVFPPRLDFLEDELDFIFAGPLAYEPRFISRFVTIVVVYVDAHEPVSQSLYDCGQHHGVDAAGERNDKHRSRREGDRWLCVAKVIDVFYQLILAFFVFGQAQTSRGKTRQVRNQERRRPSLQDIGKIFHLCLILETNCGFINHHFFCDTIARMNTNWIDNFLYEPKRSIQEGYLKTVRQTLWESELKKYETDRTQKQLLPKYQEESESKVVGMFVKYINTKSNFAKIKSEKNIVSFETTKERIEAYQARIDKSEPGKKLKGKMNQFLEILNTEKTHLEHLFKLMLCPFRHFERLSYLSFKLLVAHLEFYFHFEGTINTYLEEAGQIKEELNPLNQSVFSFMMGLDALFNAYLGVSNKEAEAKVMKLSMDIGSLQEKISNSKKEDEAQAMKQDLSKHIGSLQEKISELSFSNIVYCFIGWINVMPINDHFRKSFMDIFNSLVHRPTYLMLFTIQMVGRVQSIPHSKQSKESMQLLSDWLKIRAKPPNRWQMIRNLTRSKKTLGEGELKPSFELNLQNAAKVFDKKVHSLCTAWSTAWSTAWTNRDSMQKQTSSYVNQDDSNSLESLMERISLKLSYINTINGLLEDQLVNDLKKSMTEKEKAQFDKYRTEREEQKVSEDDIEESSRTTTTTYFSDSSSTDEDDVDVKAKATVTISVNVGQETSEIQVVVNENDTFETLESSIQNAFFGLNWRTIRHRDLQSGRSRVELRHEKLKETLLTKNKISMQELEEFDLKGKLTINHYIISSNLYYEPTPVEITFKDHILRLDNANSPVDKNKNIFRFILEQPVQDESLFDQIKGVKLNKMPKEEGIRHKEGQFEPAIDMINRAKILGAREEPSSADPEADGVDDWEWDDDKYGSLSRRLRKRDMLREA